MKKSSLALAFMLLILSLPYPSPLYANDVFQPALDGPVVKRFQTAQVMRKSGQYQKSIAELNAVVRDEPDYFLAWYNLGLAYTSKNDFKNGAMALEKAIQVQIKQLQANRIKPEFTVYNTAGWAFMQINNLPKADSYFKVAYENLDKLPGKDSKGRLLNNYGLLKMKQGDYDNAKKMFEAAASMGNPISRDNLSYMQRLRAMKRSG